MPKPPEHVYFIQAEHGGPVKIGKALDPVARLAQIQSGNPYRLVVRHAEPVVSGYSAERALHQIFRDYRMCGEWFRAHPALAAIGRCIPDEDLADEPLDYTAFASEPTYVSAISHLLSPEEANARFAAQVEASERDMAEYTRLRQDDPALFAFIRTTQRPVTVIPDEFRSFDTT